MQLEFKKKKRFNSEFRISIKKNDISKDIQVDRVLNSRIIFVI